MSKIYITGHKIPDLDSVAAAIAYQYLKSKTDSANEYIAAAAGELNKETKYILEKYNTTAPEIITSVAGKDVILVDHNEEQQSPDDVKGARILEVVDHHSVNFTYGEPLKIIIDPIGSSCSVIYKMFRANEVKVPNDLAGVMLAAVLVDTVITKSPTCTDEDKNIIEELAKIAGVTHWQEFGMEIFKIRSSMSDLSDEQVVMADYKDFDISENKFGIGQVETADTSEFDARKEGLLKALQDKKQSESYHTVILFISNIITEESTFLVASDEEEKIAKAFNAKITNNSFTAKVISRKKQVIPSLRELFK